MIVLYFELLSAEFLFWQKLYYIVIYGVICKELIVAAPFINPPDVKSDRFVRMSWPSFVL